MKRFVRMRFVTVLAFLFVTIGFRPHANAEAMREFIMSCSYGVLAGTLVGAATLAFSDKPGDNLNKVARGASFGLYAGILLGLYVVYGVPNQEESEIRSQLDSGTMMPTLKPLARNVEMPRLMVAPVVSDRGSIDGGEVRYDVLRF
jgi:hypothetical protein